MSNWKEAFASIVDVAKQGDPPDVKMVYPKVETFNALKAIPVKDHAAGVEPMFNTAYVRPNNFGNSFIGGFDLSEHRNPKKPHAKLTPEEHKQRKARTVSRRFLGFKGAVPVEFIDGMAEPSVSGKTGYWMSVGGKIILAPVKYRMAGGRCNWVRSTRKITVGKDWYMIK